MGSCLLMSNGLGLKLVRVPNSLMPVTNFWCWAAMASFCGCSSVGESAQEPNAS